MQTLKVRDELLEAFRAMDRRDQSGWRDERPQPEPSQFWFWFTLWLMLGFEAALVVACTMKLLGLM